MAITRPDIILVAGAPYVNIYTQTGIPAGTPLILQNKSNTEVRVQIASNQPATASLDGSVINSYVFLEVSGKELPAVWAKGAGRLSVQILD